MLGLSQVWLFGVRHVAQFPCRELSIREDDIGDDFFGGLGKAWSLLYRYERLVPIFGELVIDRLDDRTVGPCHDLVHEQGLAEQRKVETLRIVEKLL